MAITPSTTRTPTPGMGTIATRRTDGTEQERKRFAEWLGRHITQNYGNPGKILNLSSGDYFYKKPRKEREHILRTLGSIWRTAFSLDPNLTTINLYRSGIGPREAKILAESISTLSNRHSINLMFPLNEIGSEGAIALSQILLGRPILTSLDLEDNQIGDEGLKAIAKNLATNSSLTKLFLSKNPFRDMSALALLAGSLTINTTLTLLGLNTCNIDTQGGRSIALALENNTSLTHLSLSQNPMGDEAAGALAETLTRNTTLREVYLNRTDITKQGTDMLIQALEQNASITTLYPGGQDDNRASITPLTERNKSNRRQREATLASLLTPLLSSS